MPRLLYAKPEEIRLDAGQLELAGTLLRKWTTGPTPLFSAAALVVGRAGRVVTPRLFGKQGPEAGAETIRHDAMFLLASITKPVTYLAGMLLVERGLLNLSDRVADYIPDFAAHHKEETLVLHLFTHTSGLPDMVANNTELRKAHAPLRKFIDGAIQAMPLFAPGTNFSYQSLGTLMVAELVQKLTGRTIHEFVRKEILDRLGMFSTGLGSKGFARQRLVRVTTPAEQVDSDWGWNSQYWQELGVPWGGMFAAPEDLAILCQMMLDGGVSGETRLLSAGGIAAMAENQLADMPGISDSVRRQHPWGLGWQINPRGTAGSWADTLSRGTLGHTGATGTMCWMDPQRRGFFILLTTSPYGQSRKQIVHISNVVASAFL